MAPDELLEELLDDELEDDELVEELLEEDVELDVDDDVDVDEELLLLEDELFEEELLDDVLPDEEEELEPPSSSIGSLPPHADKSSTDDRKSVASSAFLTHAISCLSSLFFTLLFQSSRLLKINRARL